jgi:hypothetical protein
MYNLYIYEKQKENEMKHKKRLMNSQRNLIKRKMLLENLSFNYKERVKEFVTDVYIYIYTYIYI